MRDESESWVNVEAQRFCQQLYWILIGTLMMGGSCGHAPILRWFHICLWWLTWANKREMSRKAQLILKHNGVVGDFSDWSLILWWQVDLAAMHPLRGGFRVQIFDCFRNNMNCEYEDHVVSLQILLLSHGAWMCFKIVHFTLTFLDSCLWCWPFPFFASISPESETTGSVSFHDDDWCELMHAKDQRWIRELNKSWSTMNLLVTLLNSHCNFDDKWILWPCTCFGSEVSSFARTSEITT